MRQDADPERLARAALTYLAEPADRALTALVSAVGARRALEAIRDGNLPQPMSAPSFRINEKTRQALQRGLRRWRERAGDIPGADRLTGFARAGIRLVCPGDPEWPGRLADLGDDAPYALWLRGNGDLRYGCLRSVAVVGSRAATAYGSYMAADLASALATRGWTIVSGGAYGIDAAAHRGALGAAGMSVAVLACGVDRPYPAAHTGLLGAVAADGVLVSEWPPGAHVTRLRFLKRNRVMAALTCGTLVVEAAARSGALSTGRHARDLRRPLMAVPGPVTSGTSAGCHMMIRDWDATLVTRATDVTELLDPLDATGTAVPHQPVLPWEDLDPDMRAVLDVLPVRRGASSQEIAKRAGLSVQTVFGCLGALAAGGFAQRCPQGWRARTAPATARSMAGMEREPEAVK